jgi:hypothetical protein
MQSLFKRCIAVVSFFNCFRTWSSAVVPWVVGGAVRRIVRLPIRRVDWHVRVSKDHGTRTVQLRDEKF